MREEGGNTIIARLNVVVSHIDFDVLEPLDALAGEEPYAGLLAPPMFDQFRYHQLSDGAPVWRELREEVLDVGVLENSGPGGVLDEVQALLADEACSESPTQLRASARG